MLTEPTGAYPTRILHFRRPIIGAGFDVRTVRHERMRVLFVCNNPYWHKQSCANYLHFRWIELSATVFRYGRMPSPFFSFPIALLIKNAHAKAPYETNIPDSAAPAQRPARNGRSEVPSIVAGSSEKIATNINRNAAHAVMSMRSSTFFFPFSRCGSTLAQKTNAIENTALHSASRPKNNAIAFIVQECRSRYLSVRFSEFSRRSSTVFNRKDYHIAFYIVKDVMIKYVHDFRVTLNVFISIFPNIIRHENAALHLLVILM